MNTQKFSGDMADQVEKDRDELVALRAKCERLEANCAGLRSGISALTALIIEHHAASDDGTGSLVCDVCRRPESRLWWRISDAAKDNDCGKSILARLEEARRLLGRDDWHHNQSSWDEFESRRDAWLKGGQP